MMGIRHKARRLRAKGEGRRAKRSGEMKIPMTNDPMTK
jgi:hypothetical protein